MLIKQREQGGFSTLGKRKNAMLEKEPLSHKLIGVDTIGVDSVLSDETTTVDNNSFNYPLGNDFFENTENKDSSDFLYYGWPEIGNFEDIDGMFEDIDGKFRNCDSIFGLGSCKNEEMSWPNVVENISENHDFSKEYSVDDSVMTSSWDSVKSDDSYMSFVTGPEIADSKDDFTLQKNQSEWESKENYLGNGGFNYIGDVSNEVTQLPSGITSEQAFLDVHRQLQHATKQLDSRTKLCIRDSLYRLARSANKRHNRSNNFMDIEIHTNPIDRSIAHLLFQRPLDPSTNPNKVHEPIASSPLSNENYFSELTVVSEVEKMSCC
ncbi:hypothetical protein ACP275_14G101100 [Erythranthe tilingii]